MKITSCKQKKVFTILVLLLQIYIWSCKDQIQVDNKILIQNSIDSIKPTNIIQQLDSITIKYGIFFGECFGYCKTEYRFHSWGIERIKQGWAVGGDTTNYPIKKQLLPFNKKNYKELLSLLNYYKFQNLEKRIGCPDCNDGGAEWLEIKIGKKQRKVTFEYGSDIKPIKEFLAKIRMIIKEE